MAYLFTSESVSEGHPDKVADQISDALLDEFLRYDPDSKVACETLVTTGLVVCAGEVRTTGWVDIQKVARKVIRDIGYTKAAYMFDADSCGIVSAIHGQSDDIFIGVKRQEEEDQGAGDQGMMFGYANRDMDNYMPLALELAQITLQELATIRKEGKQMTYLRPDSKSQVTIEYEDDGTPIRIDTLLVSTQHDEFILPKNNTEDARVKAQKEMQQQIKQDVEKFLIPKIKKNCPERVKYLFDNGFKLIINPTGKFVIGGPHGDTGLTGRKIIVDTYGGKGAHGGGAFSGKDASKVDRSAAYAARHMAKNLVAAGVADEALVQLAYAIGMAEPVGLFVNTFGTARVKDQQGNILHDGEIARRLSEVFDLRPFAIIKRFGLKEPVFRATSTYGHFGREPHEEEVEVFYNNHPDVYTKTIDGIEKKFKKVKFFAWEELDYKEKLMELFGIL